MKSTTRFILVLAACLLACASWCKASDISQTVALDRYTLIDGDTFEHDTGFLFLDGTFHVVTADIEEYSFFGLSPDDLAPVSGKPLMDETLYGQYHNLNLIPKWIASSFNITIGFETFVIVGVKGKDDVGVAITITQQPQNVRTLLGDSAFFSVQAEPAQYITSYQWYCNKKPISGETESFLLVENITAKKAGVYRCAISTGGIPVMSQGALLTAETPITIKKQPSSLTVTAGNKATFKVVALGTGPLHYQWYVNIVGDGTLANATNSTFTIPVVQASDAGLYFLTVTNDMCFVVSRVVTLSVTP